MVARSLVLWDELARETGRALYTETGVLTLGQPDDGHTLPGFDVMRAAGLPVERLTPRSARRAFRSSSRRVWRDHLQSARRHAARLGVRAARWPSVCARAAGLREGARVVRVEPLGDGRRGSSWRTARRSRRSA